jgi:hypothetical protein
MDAIERLSLAVARLVRQYQGETPGALRRRLSGPDRKLFVEATVRAATLAFVEVHAGRLYPGPAEPPSRPAYDSGTANRLAAALAERTTP